MEKVSLTYFLDFVLKSGMPKATVVRKFKQRTDYDPRTDFYKRVRDAIVEMHQKGQSPRDLEAILARLSDAKKQAAYPDVVLGYKKFIGRKRFAWFDPPHEDWTSGPLIVTVNPEVGLEIGGKRTVGKLYFKDEPLTKRRAAIIAHLMDRVLGVKLTEPASFAVIDVRRGKSFEPSVPVPAYDALLADEAASFAAMFAAL